MKAITYSDSEQCLKPVYTHILLWGSNPDPIKPASELTEFTGWSSTDMKNRYYS